jgi:hypothetical protein
VRDNKIQWSVDSSVEEAMEPLEHLMSPSSPLICMSNYMDNAEYLDSLKDNCINTMCQAEVSCKQTHKHQLTCHYGIHGMKGCQFDVMYPLLDETKAVCLNFGVAISSNDDLNGQNHDVDSLDSMNHCKLQTPDDLTEKQKKPFQQPTTDELIAQLMNCCKDSKQMQLHSDPGSRRWFEAEDKPPAYTVSELMGKSSKSEQSKVYRLTNVLDNTKVQSVVVWETKRPTIELPKILKGDFNPTQRGMFIDFLQQFICPTACFSQENTVFWKWL